MQLLFISLVMSFPILATAHGGEKKEIIVAKIHADWCGSCKILEPSFAALKQRFSDVATFVVFDRTDKESTQKSKQIAEELHLEDAFKEHKKTGQILVFNAKSGQLLHTFNKKNTLKEMETSIKKALSKSYCSSCCI